MTEITSLCVFCGSRKGDDPAHAEAGSALGRAMADRGVRLIYGGGDIGLMSIVARAVLGAGGQVTGVIPDFLQAYEIGDPGVDELVVTDSMHSRKRVMFERADGFVVLPGGLGTLDEMIEITTWKQLQQHAKPIVLVDVNGYWAPFKALIHAVVDGGYGHRAIAELFVAVDTVEDVWQALADAPEQNLEVLTSHF